MPLRDRLDADVVRHRRGGAFLHQLVHRPGREKALRLEVRLDGRQARMAVVADERLVVDAEYGDVLRNPHAPRAQELRELEGAVVVRGEHGRGPAQLRRVLRAAQLRAPQSVVAQRRGERAAACAAPFLGGARRVRGVEKRIVPRHALSDEVERRGASDLLRGVADEHEVPRALPERFGRDVHDHRRAVVVGEQGRGRLGLRDGDDEARRRVRKSRTSYGASSPYVSAR